MVVALAHARHLTVLDGEFHVTIEGYNKIGTLSVYYSASNVHTLISVIAY